jgi:hypothetical protein
MMPWRLDWRQSPPRFVGQCRSGHHRSGPAGRAAHKFATLRAWGLASKLLIVDEVHELGEPYMAQELAKLLELHAMNGGSAILITATLPIGQRQSLADAFNRGAGRTCQPDASPAYPLCRLPVGHRCVISGRWPARKAP